MRDTWQSEGAPIVIGRLQPFAIGGTTRSSDFHRTAAIIRDLFDARGAIIIGGSSSDGCDLPRWEHRVDRDLIFIGRFRSFVEELHDRGLIEPRSRRDRAAIGEFTWWNRCQSSGRRSTNDQDHDRGAIVARSRLKCMIFGGKIEADLLRNRSHDPRPRNRPLDAIKPPPRSPPLPTISSPISPLKACISSLLFFTFDRFVKELSEFQGRSLVHRDPPAFRLDCEAIGAGLIANFSLISSNFPLEFRTSTRKNPSKFASIHENWSPILAAIG